MKKRLLTTLAILLCAVGLVLAVAYKPDMSAAEIEALYTDADSRFMEIDGARVHYRDHHPKQDFVRAPTLLLLHGTASSLHTWDGWVQELGSRYRIVRCDLPGFGLTGGDPSADYSVDRQVATLAALLDGLGIDRVAVAGNSLGGLIAWRFALAYPDRASHLILVNAAGVTDGNTASDSHSSFRAIDMARWPGAAFWLTRLTPRFLVRSSMEQVYGDPSEVEETLVERYHHLLLREGNRQALIDLMTARRAPTGPRDPADLRLPTLILWGETDSWIPLRHGRRFQELIPGSKLIVYPDIGHVPMEEIPRETARDTDLFLTETIAMPSELDPAPTPTSPES